ncbi:carbohydrate ABC transporter membrane protein 1, CUT1 family [Arthrobacter subterraneus]|uniref:Carbohydrate ABC transporter membrane protein 1, CUT1 family n=2 Tax=Arthrobacter subterraneus TaxID=335973 RepID=A0A1G8N8F6_9MICC|nr:carbohydrate ABC transporter membrane protein 1, CUT1 family [Arthrobacter subterraneus]
MAPRARALLIAAPAVLPVALVLTGALVAALLQSLGLLPIIGEPEFSTAAWDADGELLLATGISVYIAAASTVLSVVVGFLIAAYVLTSGVSSRVLAVLSAASVPIPHLVAAGAMGLLLSDAGFLARVFGMPSGFPGLVGGRGWGAAILEFGWKESAFVALVLVGSMARSAGGLCEAAATLGASAKQRMLHVLLPLALPALGVSALVVFVYTLGSYEAPWLLGPVSPEPLPVRAVRLFGSIDLTARPEAMATALASVVVGLAAIGAGLLLLRRVRGWR